MTWTTMLSSAISNISSPLLSTRASGLLRKRCTSLRRGWPEAMPNRVPADRGVGTVGRMPGLSHRRELKSHNDFVGPHCELWACVH